MGERRESSVLARHESFLLYDLNGQRLEFKLGGKERYVLGRESGCDIQVLLSLEVSRRHVEIVKVDGVYKVRDLGSRNGTYVNGKKIGDAFYPLSNRDNLSLGSRLSLVFKEGLN
ncbi:MAG: FHA domain-containing protein [archaeon]|jgi:pSer/pThr/pTyr-binding forkhead associated (FHA) protein|nr:FHA domain-containing protein [archaeon]